MLDVQSVTKSYASPDSQSHIDVLRGVTLRLDAGETIAITGPSGTGKSTLLNIIGGLDHPTSGEIRFRGRDLAELSDDELAGMRSRDIGFVFQLHHLLPQCTVFENVLVPTLASGLHADREATCQRAAVLLEKVGLTDRSSYFPSHLSGGERQRVALARAFINRPSMILADEPTGSLDSGTAAAMGRLLVDLNRQEKTALIVVTHSEKLAGLMQRQYRLFNGLCEPVE